MIYIIVNNNYIETSHQSLWLFYKNSEIKAPAHILWENSIVIQSTMVEKHNYYLAEQWFSRDIISSGLIEQTALFGSS